MPNSNGPSKLFGRDPKIVILGIVVLLVLLAVLAKFTHALNFSHQKSGGTIVQSANKNPPNSNNKSSEKTDTSSSTNQSSTSTVSSESTKLSGSSNTTLTTPSGNFVSNHGPAKNDNEESVCITTPGATCYIKFVKGDQVKKLTADVADINGEIYWKWTPDQVGLSGGPWQIIAVASLNGKSKTAQDAIPLNVKP